MNKYEAKQQARRDRLESAAESAEAASNRALSGARRMGSAIPFGQPILVGHHSEGRDRRYRARITTQYEKGFALMGKAEYFRRKAAGVGKAGISSDDPEAVQKLKAEVVALEASQARMKAANAVIRQRKGDVEEQVNGLLALGWFTNDQARELVAPDFAGRIGFAAYQLSNNNANIRRIKARIAELEKARERESVEVEGPGYTYREDTEENRVMFLFEGKPSDETRTILKAHSFKWSPSRGAWVRQLTGSGIYAAECVKKALAAIDVK